MKADLYRLFSKLTNLILHGKTYLSREIRPNIKRGEKKGVFGHVDSIDQHGISGWFLDLSRKVPPELTVLINGIPAGKISKYFYRPDVSGKWGRWCLSGFRVTWSELDIPEALFDEKIWNVKVYYEKLNRSLAGRQLVNSDIIDKVRGIYSKINHDIKIPTIDGLNGYIDFVGVQEDKFFKISGWIFHEKERIERLKLIIDELKLHVPVKYGIERFGVFESTKIQYSIMSGLVVEFPLLKEGRFSLKFELYLKNGKNMVVDIGYIEVKKLYRSRWITGTNYPFANRIENLLPIFSKSQEDFSKKVLPEPADIIVPVFNGYRYIVNLFESILKNTNPPYRLIVIDDASTDYRVVDFLKELKEKIEQQGQPEFILLRNERNLGFVSSVNKGFSLSKNHVVILNSDTKVPSGWLYRLMKPIFDNPKEIASATPFTNAGTICSFPEFLIDNELSEEFVIEEIDKIFGDVDAESFIIELPSAVGFCMGINKHALQDVGYFNEHLFGRGYGEENDWCMRAKARGYKNILVPNLFVYHKHGGSFKSEEKQKLIQENLEKIKKLHPEYLKLVEDFIKEDPPKPIREFAFLRYVSRKVDTVLLIDHMLGGGANIYSKELIEDIIKEERCVIHYTECITSITGKITVYYKDFKKEFNLENPACLKILLENAKLTEVIINNTVSYRDPLNVLETVLSIKVKNSNASLIVPIHDFYCVCPSYNLLNNEGIYCGVPEDIKVCETCLGSNIYADRLEEIRAWRDTWSKVLNSADRIVCFSENSKEIVKKAYPKIEHKKFYILPHRLGIHLRKPKLKEPQKELNVGVIGNINYQKGAKVINDLLKIIEKRGLNINLIVVGRITRAFLEKDYVNLRVLGPYERESLPDIIEKEDIHLTLFPSVWPETFSYVVEECIEMDLPIIAFDIGAPAERLRNYEKARLARLGDVEGIIKEILSFYIA